MFCNRATDASGFIHASLQQHRTLSDLDYRIEIADDERQAAMSAAVVEQAKIAAETEALARKLELARRMAAEREALHETQLATLRQKAVEVVSNAAIKGWLNGVLVGCSCPCSLHQPQMIACSFCRPAHV